MSMARSVMKSVPRGRGGSDGFYRLAQQQKRKVVGQKHTAKSGFAFLYSSRTFCT